MRIICGVITGVLALIHVGPAATEVGIGLLAAGVGIIA